MKSGRIVIDTLITDMQVWLNFTDFNKEDDALSFGAIVAIIVGASLFSFIVVVVVIIIVKVTSK